MPRLLSLLIALVSFASPRALALPEINSSAAELAPPAKIASYVARAGRARPVVAVVGENGGTVLTDFVVPYGVLAQADVADVLSVATEPGAIHFKPALSIKPSATLAEFDARYPDGADYVIVPGVAKADDAHLISWVREQYGKGATIVSICVGAELLGNAGLLKGRQATSHWYALDGYEHKFPDTHWIRNARYVIDGKIVSSAGVTAAMPTALALLESIAGTERAAAMANKLGVKGWSPQHDSAQFHVGAGDITSAIANGLFHRTEEIGIKVAPGVDEIALALRAEAYSRTNRSQAYAVASEFGDVVTSGGLNLVPDRVEGHDKAIEQMLPRLDDTPPAQVLDKTLDEIAHRYGTKSAAGIVLSMEYPWSAQE